MGGLLRFSLGKDGIPGGKGCEGKFRKRESSEPPDDIVSWQCDERTPRETNAAIATVLRRH